jgi:hypothetical protein
MAIVRAVKTGNWSDTTVWNTGALPTSSDDVYSNTFTVTINTSPTVLSISNAVTTGVTAGGSFVPTNGMVLACTGVGIMAGTSSTPCLNSALALGQSCTIVANCTGGGGNALANNGAGTITITGNIQNTSTANNVAVRNFTNGTIDVTGNISNGVTWGLFNDSVGTIKLTGSANAGSVNFALNNSGTGTLIHIGPAYASATSAAIGPGSVAQVTILTGPLLCNSPNDATAGVNPCAALRWFPADTALSTFRYEMRGATASGSPFVRPARNLYLTDAYAAGYPSATNVRTGTTYGAGGSLTGTCAVPPAASVALGVPVDNTTGTAYITASDITIAVTASLGTPTAIAGISTALTTASAVTLNQQTSSLNTSGSIGERLKLASTVATTAQQLSDALSNE